MGKYTGEPVEELEDTQHMVNWKGIAAECKKTPNKWLPIKIERYVKCPDHRAKYALKKLREAGLEADKREHYEIHDNVPDGNGGHTKVRQNLGTFSVWAMYFEADESEVQQ